MLPTIQMSKEKHLLLLQSYLAEHLYSVYMFVKTNGFRMFKRRIAIHMAYDSGLCMSVVSAFLYKFSQSLFIGTAPKFIMILFMDGLTSPSQIRKL